MGADLSIPVALDDLGVLLDPFSAASGQRYRAPCCDEPVVAHKSHGLPNSPRSHFAHLPETSCSPGESRDHKLAKALLALHYPAGRVLFKRWCLVGHAVSIVTPAGWAEREKRVGPDGAFVVADVLVSDATGPRLALEVLRSHAVDLEKRGKLAALKLPWVEVEAENVRASDFATPVTLYARQSHADDDPCPTCAALAAERAAELERARQAQKEHALEIAQRLVTLIEDQQELTIERRRCELGHAARDMIAPGHGAVVFDDIDRSGEVRIELRRDGKRVGEIAFQAYREKPEPVLRGRGFVLDLVDADALSFHQCCEGAVAANWPCTVCAERAQEQRERAAREALFAANLRALAAQPTRIVDHARIWTSVWKDCETTHRCIGGPVLVQAAWATDGNLPPTPDAVAARLEACACACHGGAL